MVLNEKIQEYIQKLPQSYLQEVLDYLELLLMKAEYEDKEWLLISIASGMRSIRDEPDLYTVADLKVKYS